MSHKWNRGRWILLTVLFMAMVLVPFFLAADRIEAWCEDLLKTVDLYPITTACLLAGLLASDILLPVPSSITSTACGSLGIIPGTFISLLGMTVSCIIGYVLGAFCARPVTSRFVGNDDLSRFEHLSKKHGLWALMISRPVPVLAEVSTVYAGIGHISFSRFLLITTLANLGISLVYSTVGHLASGLSSFLIAFLGAIALPGLVMLALRHHNRHK